MKKTVFLLIMITLVFTTSSSAKRVRVFGDVIVTFVEENKEPVWIREDNKKPKYPSAMAIANLKGCAVISFDVNAKGRVENMKALKALPSRKIASEARIAIRKWNWVNLKSEGDATLESKIVRIDYCIGGSSTEESNKLCKQQSERQCK